MNPSIIIQFETEIWKIKAVYLNGSCDSDLDRGVQR